LNVVPMICTKFRISSQYTISSLPHWLFSVMIRSVQCLMAANSVECCAYDLHYVQNKFSVHYKLVAALALLSVDMFSAMSYGGQQC
ncbi:hypothetical protein J6590_021039, partial [Homalodisca vitripennis]